PSLSSPADRLRGPGPRQPKNNRKAVYPKVNRNARLSYTVLDRIVESKLDDLPRLRRDAGAIRERAEARPAPPSFEAALRSGSTVQVIAEIKRRSPSAGDMGAGVNAVEQARAYTHAGAAALSVLTDGPHFGGRLGGLEGVAENVAIPCLRKDFTIDTLHVFEARAAGAAAVLLIVRILDDAQLADFGALAAELGMTALVEVHDEAEVERALRAGARVIGVNNRDLATFITDLSVTERLAAEVPPD